MSASCAEICLCPKMKGASFRVRREGVCETSEVLNEHLDHADSAKEGSHCGEVFAWTPVDNFVNS